MQVEDTACVLLILPGIKVVLDGIFLESVNVPMGLEEPLGIVNVFSDKFTDSTDPWEVRLPMVGEFSIAIPSGAETVSEARVAPIFPKKPNKNVSGDGLSQPVKLIEGAR